MSDSNYKHLYSGNMFIAQQIKQSLNDLGIEPVIKDNNESGRLAGFGTMSPAMKEIYVHENEYEQSLAVVNKITA